MNMNGAAVKLQPDAATSFSPYELRSSLICIKICYKLTSMFQNGDSGAWAVLKF